MRLDLLSYLFVASVSASVLLSGRYRLKPYTLNLESEVPRMLQLISNTHLPEVPEYPGLSSDAGIPLSTLKALRTQWLTQFDWKKEQASINK